MDTEVTYKVEGADAKYFSIDSSGGTGTLTPVATLPDPNPDGKAVLAADFEGKSSYSITVVASSTDADTATRP